MSTYSLKAFPHTFLQQHRQFVLTVLLISSEGEGRCLLSFFVKSHFQENPYERESQELDLIFISSFNHCRPGRITEKSTGLLWHPAYQLRHMRDCAQTTHRLRHRARCSQAIARAAVNLARGIRQ